MNFKTLTKHISTTLVVIVGVILFFVAPSEVSADSTQYGEWSGTNSSSAGGLETVPDGYGLTGIGYGSDDDRCSVFIRTAPVNPNGTINFAAVSGYQTAICNSGGGDDGNPGPRVEPIPDHYTTGWTWGAATSGGHSGDSSFPPDECYYQEYAPLTDINNRTSWGAPSDGTCNERSYQFSWLRGVIRAPPGQVIVSVGISLANDANVSMVGMMTHHVLVPQGTISADPNPIQVCPPDTNGITTLSGSANVDWEIRRDSATGVLFASGGPGGVSASTGDWVTNGMVFYLVEAGTTNVLDTVTVTHTTAGCATLSVNLTANPSSGTVPLNNVDLTADVGGTATGDIRYRFDCTNDGTYERDVTNSTDPYTAVDLCNYTSAGTYIAKVLVDRQGLTAEATTTITVNIAELAADLIVNGETDDDVMVTAGGNASYVWTSSIDATAGSSTLSISPSSPDPCGNTNSSNWGITGTSGSMSGTTCSTAGGYTYTVTYTVTGPGGSASDTVIIRLSAAPTADLIVNGETDDDVMVTAGGNASYVWTSSIDATAGSSTLSISPSSPDPCGNTNSSNWGITGTSGSMSGTTCSTAGGYTYTVTYTVTGPGGSASDTVIIRVVSAPTPTPTPITEATLGLSPNPMNLNTGNTPSSNFSLAFTGVAAGISVNGIVGTITVPIRTNINYIWSSYNASSGKATLQIKDSFGSNVSSDPCGNTSGPFPWISGTSGNFSGATAECQAGYSYVITYIAENIALQSNSSSVTIMVPLPTVSLSINKTSFVLGDSYNLAMSTSPSVGSGRPIQLCSTFTPGSGSTGTAYSNRCTGFDYTTNTSGGFNWTGTFNSADVIGTWTEWVNVQLVSGQIVQSNNVNFTVSVAAPTASLSISPSSVTAGGFVTYTWYSTNAISGSSTLSITPSSPDPCGNTNSNNWSINGTSGSFTAATASCQAGYTYTVIYTAKNSIGQTAQSVASVRVNAPVNPSISFLSPSSIAAGQSITVNINGSNFVGPMTVIWSGPISGSACCYSYTANTVSFWVSGFPAGSYTIQVRNGDGRTSNGATLTVTAPAPSASLSLSGCTRVGCSFTLALTSNQFSKPFILCSKKNGVTNPCTGTLFTSSSGGYSWSGTFDSSTVGNWEEWVTFTGIGYSSPHIFFTVTP